MDPSASAGSSYGSAALDRLGVLLPSVPHEPHEMPHDPAQLHLLTLRCEQPPGAAPASSASGVSPPPSAPWPAICALADAH